MRRLSLHPSHPERVCWGCDRYCSPGDLACGNGTIRTPHPAELFGDDWLEWLDRHALTAGASPTETPPQTATQDFSRQPRPKARRLTDRGHANSL